MQGLSYHFRDPKTGKVRKASAEEVGDLVAHTSKPVFVVCLGRDGFSEKTHPDKQVGCAEGFFDGHKPDEMHVIAVTSSQRISDTKLTNYMLRFNNQPDGHAPDYHEEHNVPTSFGMELLKDVIEPAIPYAGYTGPKEYAGLLQQAKIKCSQLNFFSHSFGGVVQAEMFDYMRDMLISKGYEPQDADSCLHCMGKLNVGNPYHITPERSLVPGIDYNSALDQLTEKYNNIPLHRDSDVLVIDRIGQSLQLCPLIGSDSVDVAQLKATEHADEHERTHIVSRMKAGGGKPDKPSPWELVVSDVSDRYCHALQLYTYKDRTRIDRENGRVRTSSQAFPGAEVANEFMMDLFKTSKAAADSGQPRDVSQMVDALQTRLTPPAARQKLGEDLKTVQANFSRYFER